MSHHHYHLRLAENSDKNQIETLQNTDYLFNYFHHLASSVDKLCV